MELYRSWKGWLGRSEEPRLAQSVPRQKACRRQERGAAAGRTRSRFLQRNKGRNKGTEVAELSAPLPGSHLLQGPPRAALQQMKAPAGMDLGRTFPRAWLEGSWGGWWFHGSLQWVWGDAPCPYQGQSLGVSLGKAVSIQPGLFPWPRKGGGKAERLQESRSTCGHFHGYFPSTSGTGGNTNMQSPVQV